MPEPVKNAAPAKPPTITVVLDDKFHAYVLSKAKADERSPAKWLKRYIQERLAQEPKEPQLFAELIAKN